MSVVGFGIARCFVPFQSPLDTVERHALASKCISEMNVSLGETGISHEINGIDEGKCGHDRRRESLGGNGGVIIRWFDLFRQWPRVPLSRGFRESDIMFRIIVIGDAVMVIDSVLGQRNVEKATIVKQCEAKWNGSFWFIV
jgi:hypothetical protein